MASVSSLLIALRFFTSFIPIEEARLAEDLVLDAGLTSSVLVANEDCVANLILCGQVVESALTTRDCAVPSGHGDLWFFPVYSPQAAAAAIRTEGFDPLIGIVSPAGTVLD